MLYLSEKDIHEIGVNWKRNISAIEDAVKCMVTQDYAQPVKPYLRYRNLKNRIIAMPAFVGGDINKAGIKWIASFPGNIRRGLARAHSVVILNDAETGEPVAIICTALLSIIRTASVSGMMIDHFDAIRKLRNINIGVTGFGPIGQYHVKMCQAVLGDRMSNIFLYDTRPIDSSLTAADDRIRVTECWEDAYVDSDIFITCTVAEAPYIDKPPKPGSLHLNVSLRDYKSDMYEWFRDSIIVDDWNEVCRERTDIEMMHLEKGLRKEHTRSVADVIGGQCLNDYDKRTPVMFNPMGMAIFDIAIGNHYYQAALNRNMCTTGAIHDVAPRA